MALDQIISAIDEEATRAVEKIRAEAESRAQAIRDQAARRASVERERMSHVRDGAADEAVARIINRARLEADRTLRSAQERLFSDAVEEAKSRLGHIRHSESYGDVFRALLDEAHRALPDAQILIVDAADAERARATAEELGLRLEVQTTLETIGGLELSTSDGRTFDNLLESRLARAEPWLRSLAITSCPELAEGVT